MKGRIRKKFTVAMVAALLMTTINQVHSDEGMWLYDDPPLEQLQSKYGYRPTPQWLEHLQKSSIRFNNGGSGSFVSEDGLVLSNHHVGAGALEKLSTQEKNILADGFYARTRAEELKCHDLELNVLMSIEDVTEQVNAVITPELSPEEALKARREVMSRLEQESLEATGLRSDVVTLFQGGKYSLYRYKRYTDVRLVFAPESDIGFFGGDPDNFEYPRYNLDVSFFRVYENDQPAKVEHYLDWSADGVSDGELIFVSGHPGSTSRLITHDELIFARDLALPYTLERLYRLGGLYLAWADRNRENARRAHQAIMGVQNTRKALGGRYAGLLDPDLVAGKALAERSLINAMKDSERFKGALPAYEVIGEAQKAYARDFLPIRMWEWGQAFNSSYFGIARTLLRHSVEKEKPNGERLREYRDSNKVSLELGLFSEAPIYDDFETLRLCDALKFAIGKLGYNDSLVQKVLDGKTPEARAAELIQGTTLKAVQNRKAIYEMSTEEILKLNDPMIELAQLVDEPSRALRKVYEEQDEQTRQAHDKIAQARFALLSEHTYPDATFTLRLSYGAVLGYEETGRQIPFQTTVGGMYAHAEEHQHQPPFRLPDSWMKAREKVDPATPCNFVSTPDIIGGNSGSPVVNRAGEFVGIVFDGNIPSLVWDYAYSDKQGRATSVNSQFIMEALRKVYDAGELAREIKNGNNK